MSGLTEALKDWYPVAMVNELASGESRQTRLLGQDLMLRGNSNGLISASTNGQDCKVQQAFDHYWVSISDHPNPLIEIPDAADLDIAHFPFVHTDVLGTEPHTEVYKYDVRIDEQKDEVIASNIRFFQPQAAKSAEGGIHTEYIYRVPAPMVSILYKTCPQKPDALDVIALFVQPLDEETCNVWPWMALYDDTSTQADLIQFQQFIFLQDRSILENQIPRKLPIDPGHEIPTKADLTSVSYRRWLKNRGAWYGALENP